MFLTPSSLLSKRLLITTPRATHLESHRRWHSGKLQQQLAAGGPAESTAEEPRNIVARGMKRFEIAKFAPPQPAIEVYALLLLLHLLLRLLLLLLPLQPLATNATPLTLGRGCYH